MLRLLPPPQETPQAEAPEMTGCLWPAPGYSAAKAAGRIPHGGPQHPQRLPRPGEPCQTCDGLLKSDLPLVTRTPGREGGVLRVWEGGEGRGGRASSGSVMDFFRMEDVDHSGERFLLFSLCFWFFS